MFLDLKKIWSEIVFCSMRAGLMLGGWGGVSRVNVGRRLARVWFGLVRLSAKYKTSRMFFSGIFWYGCCCCSCDKTEVWTLDFGLEFDNNV